LKFPIDTEEIKKQKSLNTLFTSLPYRRMEIEKFLSIK